MDFIVGKRPVDPVAGTEYLYAVNSEGRRVVAVALADETGEQAGIAASPLIVERPAADFVYNASTYQDATVFLSAPNVPLEVVARLKGGVLEERHLHIFNSAVPPVLGMVPMARVEIEARQDGGGRWANWHSFHGMPFDEGFAAAISSTYETYTPTTANEAVFDAYARRA